LIEQGADDSEIINSKNYKKLNKTKKNKIKKLLNMRKNNKSVTLYLQKCKEKRNKNKKKNKKDKKEFNQKMKERKQEKEKEEKKEEENNEEEIKSEREEKEEIMNKSVSSSSYTGGEGDDPEINDEEDIKKIDDINVLLMLKRQYKKTVEYYQNLIEKEEREYKIKEYQEGLDEYNLFLEAIKNRIAELGKEEDKKEEKK